MNGVASAHKPSLDIQARRGSNKGCTLRSGSMPTPMFHCDSSPIDPSDKFSKTTELRVNDIATISSIRKTPGLYFAGTPRSGKNLLYAELKPNTAVGDGHKPECNLVRYPYNRDPDFATILRYDPEAIQQESIFSYRSELKNSDFQPGATVSERFRSPQTETAAPALEWKDLPKPEQNNDSSVSRYGQMAKHYAAHLSFMNGIHFLSPSITVGDLNWQEYKDDKMLYAMISEIDSAPKWVQDGANRCEALGLDSGENKPWLLKRLTSNMRYSLNRKHRDRRADGSGKSIDFKEYVQVLDAFQLLPENFSQSVDLEAQDFWGVTKTALDHWTSKSPNIETNIKAAYQSADEMREWHQQNGMHTWQKTAPTT